MKITNGQAYSMYEALGYMKQQNDIYLPVKTGMKILKNLRALEPSYKDITALRDTAIVQFGIRQDDGSFNIPEEHLDSLNSEINELAFMEIEIDLVHLNLQEIENLSIPLDLLDALWPIIDGE